ncbi:FHA domain-containing protein [Rathayibacter toxicus]|uniref:Phosphopeptide-binding protein n=1 Tax=Rathayibacter toxicus TaxID=145458 RepID=A0A0C5B8J3_9MICO|nr:FHA domain-containing protein [Rathayibacter toxicus]AJM77093.1 phosphopeptide-binding protein [Rathayibacter toxicus]ALS57077.1 phosphopeptide-binding protein [Rathayibacter toxicus]KKM46098.1 phosphopeptide-binding protein [Rathayibacter toxicus]PPG23049.1 FHA domain-containing protein [Rathayibacter toxicus]PPG47631.1 FHA domain-containing protein [Rathayibacter toxicus]
MSYFCPEGHTSVAGDYCDICDEPIAAASTAHPATEVIPSVGAVCPHCSFPNEIDALLCENCGYDFTAAALPTAAPAHPATEVIPVVTSAVPSPDEATAISAASDSVWIAELWVDPEWYAERRADDPMPSPGSGNTVMLCQRSLLVGRPSVSRGISPQIDCGSDPGVSRRHCQLSTDGYRWWVEDLQSANGTYLASAGAPLPNTPIPPGQRREIEEGDRLYLGAWTRLALRPALPGEG